MRDSFKEYIEFNFNRESEGVEVELHRKKGSNSYIEVAFWGEVEFVENDTIKDYDIYAYKWGGVLYTVAHNLLTDHCSERLKFLTSSPWAVTATYHSPHINVTKYRSQDPMIWTIRLKLLGNWGDLPTIQQAEKFYDAVKDSAEFKEALNESFIHAANIQMMTHYAERLRSDIITQVSRVRLELRVDAMKAMNYKSRREQLDKELLEAYKFEADKLLQSAEPVFDTESADNLLQRDSFQAFNDGIGHKLVRDFAFSGGQGRSGTILKSEFDLTYESYEGRVEVKEPLNKD